MSFSGKYGSDLGLLVLEQQGQRVTGCLPNGETLIDGTVEGTVFSGTYDDGSSSGKVAFVLTTAGDLAGVYGNADMPSPITRWDATPTKEPVGACRKPERKLAEELKAKGRVVLRGILFDTGKDVIRGESIPVLESLAAAMKADAESRYVIEGHTDNRGQAGANQTLSEKRAASVEKWLAENGVAEKRLATQGFGQTREAMSNDSEAGRAANRRVEVAIK